MEKQRPLQQLCSFKNMSLKLTSQIFKNVQFLVLPEFAMWVTRVLLKMCPILLMHHLNLLYDAADNVPVAWLPYARHGYRWWSIRELGRQYENGQFKSIWNWVWKLRIQNTAMKGNMAPGNGFSSCVDWCKSFLFVLKTMGCFGPEKGWN